MKDNPFKLETEVLSAYLELHLADKAEEAWQQVSALRLQPATNPLHCFLLANMAMRSGRNDLALRTLEAQPRLGTATDFPYLDFMLGLAKIRTLDPTARLYFTSFNVRYAGRHFKEEARQKIAWSYLLKGDVAGYRQAMTAVTGGSSAGGDENALREAALGRPPHQGLLRARLLFDGNYCTRARAQLEQIDTQTLTPEEQLEYLYRTGRVLDGLQEFDGALSFYLSTVQAGRDSPAFYACKAALQAGLIEEKRSNKIAASKHFQACLNISPEEYKTALHLLAKAGLDRMR
jgi:tetratricopeptide (TPR) repeat protein